jgi:ketosteroid isomerase-like protein
LAQPTPVNPGPPSPAPDPDALRKTLISADLAFSRACELKGSAEAFYEYAADDGVCLFPDAPPIQGRDAIKVYLEANSQGALSWKPRESEAAPNGQLGFTWGFYQLRTSNPDGLVQTTYGKYVIIWKKPEKGPWKVNLYSATPSPPPR